jgi:hypothetical protein
MRFKFIFLGAFVFITVSVSGCATPAPRVELQEALASFKKRVARADQAIFFYAGAFDGTAGHSPFSKAILNPMDLKI